MRLTVKYALFALACSALNLITQYAILATVEGRWRLHVAIAAGTVVGLVAKYKFDRRWIFYDRSSRALEHAMKFSLYSTTGLITTLIFWGAEWLFHQVNPSDGFTLLGAALGLAAGYVVKYQLDKRFVFAA